MSKTVYLKAARNTEVNQPSVSVGQVVDVYCSDKPTMAKCRAEKLFVAHGDKQKYYTFSIVQVIEVLQKVDSSLEFNNLGEMDFIVNYQPCPKKIGAWDWIKTAVVCGISLVGAAFAIMTFNNDGCVKDVFANLYQLITGQESNGITVIEIAYSIGLPIGIIGFFNHFSKLKFSTDPTPLEVQMRTYEKDVDNTLIENDSRKEEGVDVS